MEIREAIKKLRGKRTQKELAVLLEVDVGTISRWERGDDPRDKGRKALIDLALSEGHTDLAKQFVQPSAQLLMGNVGIAPPAYPPAHQTVHDALEKALRAGVPAEQILGALIALEAHAPKRRSVAGE